MHLLFIDDYDKDDSMWCLMCIQFLERWFVHDRTLFC